MKRTQVQLDETTHAKLRRLAYEQRRSIASLLRDSVDQYLGANRNAERPGSGDFLFVGAGRRKGKRRTSIARDHDEAFAEAIESRWRGRRLGRRKR